jgi:hypothetical protein
VGGAGNTLITVPDGQIEGAFSANLAIVIGGFLGANAVSLLVFRLVFSAFLADVCVVVPGGWSIAGDASSGICEMGCIGRADACHRIFIENVGLRAAREAGDFE